MNDMKDDARKKRCIGCGRFQTDRCPIPQTKWWHAKCAVTEPPETEGQQNINRSKSEFGEVVDAIVGREGEPATLEEAYAIVQRAAREVMFQRHRRYGSGNIARHGEYGVAVRADDKLARIGNMLKSNQSDHTGESREDSWGDLSNYGHIAVLLIRGWWHLPAERQDQTGGGGWE